MITCPNCKKQLAEGTRFCDACGTKVVKTIFCPNCGEQNSTEFAFCQKCGAAIAENAVASAASADSARGKKNILQALPRKAILFGGIGIAAVVVIVLVISMLSGGKSKGNYSLYLKDGEIVYTDYSKKGPMEITSRLVNGGSISQSELSSAASGLGSYIAFSKDGSRVFYPDRIDYNSNGITLYYRDINKPNQEPVKIDSDVKMYSINEKGTQLVYVKGSDGVLYSHNLKDKEKIASGVASYSVTKDLKKIGYRTNENSYYLWTADKDAVKMASDISRLEYVAEDLSVIYYIKDGALYKQAAGSVDKEKIASDVSSVISVCDSGELYYTKTKDGEKNLLDYVDDDMSASDAVLTEPEYPAFPASPSAPSWWNYDTTEEYNAAKAEYDTAYAEYEAAYNQLRDDYNAAYEAYRAKLVRDSLRNDLQHATIQSTEYSLYYYNGTEGTVVTDALVSEWDVTCADEKPVLVLQVYNQSNVQKVKLSEISSSYEVRERVTEALYSSSDKYIAVGSELSVLEQTKAEKFTIAPDGSMVYFLDDVSASGDGDLYKVAISNGQAGNPEMYTSDVSNRAIFFTDGNKLAYYKNVSNGKGDLYIDGVEIDYDARLSGVSHVGAATLYYTDWDSNKGYGTLKMFKNGNKTKIADDVHDFVVTNSDGILYLYDYSTRYYTGTLYLYNNGKPQKIDDDVIALIPVNNHPVMGGGYW